MKIYHKNIIRSLFITGFILSLFICSPAQSKKIRQPRWNWKKHQKETINYAKTYLVSDIEPNLPRQSFNKWFRELVGKEAKLAWLVNDCGENATIPGHGDGRKDLTMCVEADAFMGSDVVVSVFIQFGTLKDGIMPGKPIVRCIYVGREDNPPKSVADLNELSEKLYEIIN